ncbi:MAG: hypothetical protein ABJA69_08405, partial [Acidobacteriaceae bacterium]
MRNFTNATVFDDTLPVADGVIEVGTNVPLPELKAAMQDWFRRASDDIAAAHRIDSTYIIAHWLALQIMMHGGEPEQRRALLDDG